MEKRAQQYINDFVKTDNDGQNTSLSLCILHNNISVSTLFQVVYAHEVVSAEKNVINGAFKE
jgi:hypothetical protein